MIGDERVRRMLEAHTVPPAAPEAVARTLAAAAPLLAVHARRASLRGVVRPLLAALVPLPLILAVDFAVVWALHAALATVLPAAVSTFVAANYAVLLALLLSSTYAAVPLLVDRQLRARLETSP